MPISLKTVGRAAVAALAFTAACAAPDREAEEQAPRRVAGTVYTVTDTIIRATFDAAGVAAPLQQATLSTRIMGTVTAVLVLEGDAVRAGQTLVRIDARELDAKTAQVSASIEEAEAMHREALASANRIRALYAESAATRSHLDAAETGLARAEAGLRTAKAAAVELAAVSSYAEIRAPFAGVVTKRFVDPGAFAAPGAPLIAVQDASQLRLTVSAAPDAAAGLRRGRQLDGTIEGRPVRATIEGVVPAVAGNLYTINARVPNADGASLSGSSATLALPLGERPALVVPSAAIAREGDLLGVTLRTAAGDVTRWVRVGSVAGDFVEVTAGLRAGDRVVVPPPVPNELAGRN
jgi:RND family efflux transporter MFP subunit